MATMATAPRPLDELRHSVEAHLAREIGAPVTVRSITPLAGGACQDNLRVELTTGEGDLTLVLRSDARGSLPGSLDRRVEQQVIEAATAAGVKTPRARYLATGLVREGAHAYFLDWVEGEALGRRVVSHASLEAARKDLVPELARELAKIHSIRGGIPLLEAPGGDPAASALHHLRALVDRLPEPRAAIELGIAWLEDHRVPAPEVTLVHGDFRTGNFLVTPRGLAAVLDWEFAHWGAPEEDLAWLCLRDWRFGRLDRPAGGIDSREALHEAYAAASGRKVDPRAIRFWEILENVRWAAGSAFQGERALTGGETDLELLAIARRTSEMELEALRLMELA
jgi:aminoglycoside phosphotransferase (APT) family kinase protein